MAIWLIVATVGCSPVDIANALTPKTGYAIEQDIAYGPGPRQKLDLYLPEQVASSSPAIVFFYGGRWQFGKKQDYLFVGQALASAGFVTLIADYRLYPEVRWQGIVEDAAAALAKASELVPDRSIVLAGHSAGAHLAAMVALDEDRRALHGVADCRIGALVGLAGPYDFLPLREADIIEVFGPGDAGPETQPIAYVNAGDPPALLLHGSDDDTVVPGNSTRLAMAMAADGIHAEARLYDDLGHVGLIASFAWPTRFLSPALDEMVAFLRAVPRRENC